MDVPCIKGCCWFKTPLQMYYIYFTTFNKSHLFKYWVTSKSLKGDSWCCLWHHQSCLDKKLAIAIVFSKTWLKKNLPTQCKQSFSILWILLELFKHDWHFKNIIGFMFFILTMCHDFNQNVTKYLTNKYCRSITTL
jgi:hypothetical protein